LKPLLNETGEVYLMITHEVLMNAIALLNNGVSLNIVSKTLGVNRTQLSRHLNTLIKKNLLVKYLNVFIDRLQTPVSIVIGELKQKATGLRCLLGNPPLIISYYSYTSRPTIISYVRDDYSGIDARSIAADACRIVFYGRISQVLVPIQVVQNPGFTLLESSVFIDKDILLDEADEVIALELFRLFNPCIFGRWRTSDLVGTLKKSLGARDTYHHFTRHAVALTRKKYVYKDSGMYSLIFASSDTLDALAALLSQLHESQILIDVEQANMVSTHPFIGIIHAWISLDKLYDYNKGHDLIEGVSYAIYPVFSVH